MNIKFNLGAVKVNVEGVEVDVESMSYEVTDLSLSEYTQVLKTVLVEGASFVKEINQAQDEQSEREHARFLERNRLELEAIERRSEANHTSFDVEQSERRSWRDPVNLTDSQPQTAPEQAEKEEFQTKPKGGYAVFAGHPFSEARSAE